MGKEHDVEGQEDGAGVDGIDPPDGGKKRQSAGRHQRNDEGDQHLLLLRAGEERGGGKSPARAERRGAERGAPDPELGVLLGAARAPVGEQQHAEGAGADEDERLPLENEFRGPQAPEIGGEQDAEKDRRADAGRCPPVDELAPLARHLRRDRRRAGGQ